MGDIYSKNHKVSFLEVNRYKVLRASALFTMLQDATLEYFDSIGVGSDRTFFSGNLWIIGNQHVEISRLPGFEEKITINSWCGELKHHMIPCYSSIVGADGTVLVKSSSLWALLNEETRTLLEPKESNIEIKGHLTGDELSTILGPMPNETASEASFTVPFSYIDMNGHMNNVRYFDLADNYLEPILEGRSPKRIIARYCAETILGEELVVAWGADVPDNPDKYYLKCDGANGTHFKMQIEF